MQEGASFVMVVRRAAEVMELQLPMVQVKANVLSELLQPGVSLSEPLLPFNEALTDVLLRSWVKPCTDTPMQRITARCHRSTLGDPAFLSLSHHPTPEILVVQASTSRIYPTPFLPHNWIGNPRSWIHCGP